MTGPLIEEFRKWALAEMEREQRRINDAPCISDEYRHAGRFEAFRDALVKLELLSRAADDNQEAEGDPHGTALKIV